MKIDFTGLVICADTPTERYAAEILKHELYVRTGIHPQITSLYESGAAVCLVEDKSISEHDRYVVKRTENRLTVSAGFVRGLIFGIGLFLRKTEYHDRKIVLIAEVEGEYIPQKPIRGHQLGYRPLSNTYEKWTVEEYRRYYLDLMFFGANTVELMAYEKGQSHRNALMVYDEEEMLTLTSRLADELDLNVSLWLPNSEDTLAQALENRRRIFENTPRINDVFVPGGDPGELAPKELMTRCRAFNKLLQKSHPGARLWVSAQAPHNFPNWPEDFIKELQKDNGDIYGVIYGPNHAYPLKTLKEKLPPRLPLRFYPDITHNVRCEYPVHYDKDDWNYALTTVNSRESINPRPTEYARLHKQTNRYFVGSVSYSEGVNDDINKAVYSALDFCADTPINEIIADYCRLFFYGADTAIAQNAVFGLEENWQGNPAFCQSITSTYEAWCKLLNTRQKLTGNWRFLQGLLRAGCDLYVQKKLQFENGLIADMRGLALKGDWEGALAVLNTPAPELKELLCSQIENIAGELFCRIGMQLDTEHYFADSWERGAVLDTLDLPVTDRLRYITCLQKAQTMPKKEGIAYIKRILNRTKVSSDEVYFCVAYHPLSELGVEQTPEYYRDFQGDKPNCNNGTLPTNLFCLFDHLSFRYMGGGFLPNTDYLLTVIYRNTDSKSKRFTVTVNGHELYRGVPFGGRHNSDYEEEQLPEGYSAMEYKIPQRLIENGSIAFELAEPTVGFEVAEFFLTKKRYQKESAT